MPALKLPYRRTGGEPPRRWRHLLAGFLSHRLALVRHCCIGSPTKECDLMDESDWLAERFQAHRGRLRAVAYRMLGSLSEADDAVQGAWLRLSRTDPRGVENMDGWLTTVVARECLDMLRARAARREEPLGVRVPDPIVSTQDGSDPEQQALLAEGVGLAMLVVLDTLAPAERLAFVLHDTFAVPFEEIAPIVGRSPEATRQIASRARRRVQGAARVVPAADLARQRAVVDAFFAAARDGDFAALLAVLDPNVVVRADGGAVPAAASRVVRGAADVAEEAIAADGFSRLARLGLAQPVLVNGAAGVIVAQRGRLFAVVGFTVRHGKIVEIDVLADPDRLSRLDLALVD
jgi:RNA polymerase sigma-70 factor, ECF subfamily